MERIKLEVTDGIAVITLAYPPVNAMDTQMRRRIIEVFDEVSDRDDVRVAILTGEGKIFCAGADLNDRPDPEKPGIFPEHNRITREMLNVIRECAKPVICAVNGAALGGGPKGAHRHTCKKRGRARPRFLIADKLPG